MLQTAWRQLLQPCLESGHAALQAPQIPTLIAAAVAACGPDGCLPAALRACIDSAQSRLLSAPAVAGGQHVRPQNKRARHEQGAAAEAVDGSAETAAGAPVDQSQRKRRGRQSAGGWQKDAPWISTIVALLAQARSAHRH